MKSIIIAILTLFIYSTSLAQAPSSASSDTIAHYEAVSLKNNLNLSQDTTDKIFVFTKMHLLRERAIKNLKDTSARRIISLQNERKRYRDDIHSVLNENQYADYLLIIANRRSQFRANAAQQNMRIKEVPESN